MTETPKLPGRLSLPVEPPKHNINVFNPSSNSLCARHLRTFFLDFFFFPSLYLTDEHLRPGNIVFTKDANVDTLPFTLGLTCATLPFYTPLMEIFPSTSDNPDDSNHTWYYEADDDVPMGAPLNAPSQPTRAGGE